MEIKVSDVVAATRGRDAGKLFFVIGMEENFAFIANGADRRVEKPKKKKIHHLERVFAEGGRTAEKLANGEKVTNREIKRALSGIKETHQEAKGGMQKCQRTMS